ncbi:hypothetical protein C6P42_004728 [Pichia californica]|nr:hypothetical protein C6P42_004728 [[Candida] californica]
MTIDSVYFYYFIIHTPITIFMDATFVIPYEYQNSIQKALGKFHIEKNKDFLAIETPLWIKFFVVWELIFQLPFFTIAIINYLQNKRKGYSKNTWIPFLIYGFNAGFTTLLCLIYVILESKNHGLTNGEFLNLIGLYTPTMILPFYMMYDFWIRINKELLNKEKSS